MVELDGEIHRIEIEDLPGTFTEAPWIHKYNDTYYMSFAMNFPEQIAYATSDSLEGPWTYGGLLMDAHRLGCRLRSLLFAGPRGWRNLCPSRKLTAERQ